MLHKFSQEVITGSIIGQWLLSFEKCTLSKKYFPRVSFEDFVFAEEKRGL